MSRILFGTFLLGALAACAPAYADRYGGGPVVATPGRVDAPYQVDILDEYGSPLRAYSSRGRYYVLGDQGDRYLIRVTNPTPSRVEAVVTVDGLDVVDGEGGDLRKRGYIVPPYGELRLEGFRTSTQEVATFRFSSVRNSYAGRKGKARNVGVIAVALFAEQAPPQVIAPPPPPPYYYEDDYGDRVYPQGESRAPSASGRGAGGVAKRPAAPAPAPAPAAPSRAEASEAPKASAAPGAADEEVAGRACCGTARRERPGLGTEFGEQRYSSVSFTRFVRASSRPTVVVELRYNDAAGLTALGIPVEPYPDYDEIETRESANPFPGDHSFARPPAGIY